MNKRVENLEMAIINEGKKNGFWEKSEFWKTPTQPEHSGFDDPPPDIEKALANLTPTDLNNSDTRALQAAAGAFIYGKPAPELSPRDRKRIEYKIANGQPLSPAERLWITTQQANTDMF